jgi:uncharacterized protein (TIGR03000 family)
VAEDQAMQDSDDSTVALRVIVPKADARVWIEDNPTRQSGTERQFVSPPLETGKEYTYHIRASWTDENGEKVSMQKQLKVSPGEEFVANFTERNEETAAAPVESRRGKREPRREQEAKDEDQDVRASTSGDVKILRIDNRKLIVTDLDGKNQRTYLLPANTTIMIDNKAADLSGLQAGTQASLTFKPGASKTVTRVEVKAAASPEEGAKSSDSKRKRDSDQYKD